MCRKCLASARARALVGGASAFPALARVWPTHRVPRAAVNVDCRPASSSSRGRPLHALSVCLGAHSTSLVAADGIRQCVGGGDGVGRIARRVDGTVHACARAPARALVDDVHAFVRAATSTRVRATSGADGGLWRLGRRARYPCCCLLSHLASVTTAHLPHVTRLYVLRLLKKQRCGSVHSSRLALVR